MQRESLALLWAKFDDQNPACFHPLICHLIDSGNVADAIWQNVLTEPLKNQFSNLFALGNKETRQVIQFISALHDIGKASFAFQSKNPEIQKKLEKMGLPFPMRSRYSPQRHDLISLWILQDTLCSNAFFSQEDAELISQVLGGHHGYFHSALEIQSLHRQVNLGDVQWHELRMQIFQMFCELIQPPKLLALHGDESMKQSTLILLAGLVVVADWLASDKVRFPYWQENDLNLLEYNRISSERALAALETTGWISWKPAKTTRSFFDLFGFSRPNPIQQAVIDHIDLIQPPFLAILEAPTGQGKTEAAFFLAERAIHSISLRGLYVAMPTMATSNQMFSRTIEFLNHRYPQTFVNIQLAHSQAAWNPDLKSITLESLGQDLDSEELRISAMKWFQAKKRTLLAPFGVGTIDQALISVLKTKHFFLRLFGLAHKVLIFDEVHAYDVYMSTLFIRLLEWLKQLGCSVIILSATLPQAKKKEIASVYASIPPPEAAMQEYPSLTFITSNHSEVVQVETGTEQRYNLDQIGADPPDMINYLSDRINEGGCAAVVCNTVKKAQQIYLAIKEAGLIDTSRREELLLLFHARSPQLWRQEIESEVLARFGRQNNDKRPSKAILVATQVIEQSLDLDFDLMISELAPVDLLIQRAGRLHRHIGRKRPGKLSQPNLAIAFLEKNGEPDFGESSRIYDESILLATYYVLKPKNDLRLPKETRDLIEKVYNPLHASNFSIEQQTKLRPLYEKSAQCRERDESIAYEKIIPRPDDETLLRLGAPPLEEDDPEIHQAFQALTRLALPSVCLVCLREIDGRIFALDGSHQIDLQCEPNDQQVEALLKSSINVIKSYRISQLTESVCKPRAWRKNAWLNHSYPIVFNEDIYKINEKLSLHLSRELGLQYVEEE